MQVVAVDLDPCEKRREVREMDRDRGQQSLLQGNPTGTKKLHIHLPSYLAMLIAYHAASSNAYVGIAENIWVHVHVHTHTHTHKHKCDQAHTHTPHSQTPV